jgi:glucose/arabinose dehydrogenase
MRGPSPERAIPCDHLVRRMNLARATLVALALTACSRTRPATLPTVDHPAARSDAPIGYVTVGTDVRLPPPHLTDSASNPARLVARPPTAALRGPDGTRVDLWADNLDGVRWIAPGPDDDVFATDSRNGELLVLRDADRDGRIGPGERFVFASRLSQPFGVALHPSGWLYVANTDGVVRFAYTPGQTVARAAPERVCDLPGFGYNQHWTRNLAFSPDGAKLLVTVGSETNHDVEPDPRRAAISEYDLDGGHHRVFASGLRNPIGLAFHPDTGVMFTVVNERDTLGDDLVPDYLTSVRDGGFYGWPYSYFGAHEDPAHRSEAPDLVRRAIVPDMALGAHVAALGLSFPTRGAIVPRGDAVVSLHGSWNRRDHAGYKLVRVPFRDGHPTGELLDLVTGWTLSDTDVWGRPVGVIEQRDGAMLIVDDGARVIWRLHRGA